jgi:hypothetical protein
LHECLSLQHDWLAGESEHGSSESLVFHFVPLLQERRRR